MGHLVANLNEKVRNLVSYNLESHLVAEAEVA